MASISFLNAKRLRDYPRLVFIASWVVLFINLLFHRGWLGGLTNYLVFGDFLTYYSAGKLYINDIGHLYDLAIQQISQIAILGVKQPIELSIFSYPPNSALLLSALTYISLVAAIILWCIISVFSVIIATKLITKHLTPEWLTAKGLSSFQLSIIIFSSFPFIEGFEKGQTHALTFLLIVGILVSTKCKRWFLAGFLAALSTYKPHFIIGFLILWLVLGNYKALVSFIVTSLVWNGVVILTKGIDPYLSCLKLANQVIYLPYTSSGFPISLMATPFSLVASMLPINLAALWNRLYLLVGICLIILFMIIVYKYKKQNKNLNLVYALTILLPFMVFPHALLHDLLLMVPVLILLLDTHIPSRNLLCITIGIYIAVTILPLAGYFLNIALLAIIPTGIFIFCIQRSLRSSRA